MKDFKHYWNRSYTWEDYKDLIHNLLEQNKTTGPNQDEQYVAFTRLNLQRMKRVEKTLKLDEDLKKLLESKKFNSIRILVISEGWCGDAAQSVPVISDIAQAYPDKLDLKIFLRDEDTDLIDQFLTNGGRSIPQFIFLDHDFNLLGNWGPRPVEAQKLFNELKADGKDHAQIVEQIQLWYARDKSESLQREVLEKLQNF